MKLDLRCIESGKIDKFNVIQSRFTTARMRTLKTGTTSQEFNGMITISDTAKFIWENIEKVDSLEEMIRMVLDTYEIDEETARRDTIAFVGALVENGFIECTREDGTW